MAYEPEKVVTPV